MKFSEVKVGDSVEVTNHTSMAVWYSAKIVRVTKCFIDVLRDDWATSPHHCRRDDGLDRYRRVDGREVAGYCGFYSHVRVKQ